MIRKKSKRVLSEEAIEDSLKALFVAAGNACIRIKMVNEVKRSDTKGRLGILDLVVNQLESCIALARKSKALVRKSAADA